MLEVRQTDVFAAWFAGLWDRKARPGLPSESVVYRWAIRVNVKPVGSGVSEMRINYGPGYRVYFVGRRNTVTVLLCGGDKRSQDRDIARALELAKEV